MRVRIQPYTMLVDSTPGCMWLFGLWFVAGGLLAVYATFFATNAHELSWGDRAVVLGIGIGSAAAGLFFIRSHPAVHARFDGTTGRAVVSTRGLARRATRVEFDYADVRGVEVKQDADSDGDPIFLIRLWLADGRKIPLHAQPVHGREWVTERATRIRQWLGQAEP